MKNLHTRSDIMSWKEILKQPQPDPFQQWQNNITFQNGLWMDAISYDDPRYPLGRPQDLDENELDVIRVFVLNDETDWEDKAAAEGNPKSGDNPYYAPEHGGPDNWADIRVNEEDYTIEYVAGSRKFFTMLERTLQETKEEMNYGG